LKKGILKLFLYKPGYMKESALDKELMMYITLLDKKQKEAILAMIKSFLKPQTIEEYNRELDEAIERIEKGEFVTMEELLKEMKTW
jgi:predicted transcriptional regulator